MPEEFKIEWTPEGYSDFVFLAKNEKKLAKRILQLLEDIQRNPFVGIGKPEPLRYNLSGCWSRRVNSVHRIIYEVRDKTVYILQARSHYGQ